MLKNPEKAHEIILSIFFKHSVLSDSKEITEKYYNYAFRYYCRQNIMHVEIHIMLTGDIDECCKYIEKMRSAYYNVKKEYPYFTVRIIGAGVKADNDRIETTMYSGLGSREKFDSLRSYHELWNKFVKDTIAEIGK